jgi:Chaperone of endosialidase
MARWLSVLGFLVAITLTSRWARAQPYDCSGPYGATCGAATVSSGNTAWSGTGTNASGVVLGVDTGSGQGVNGQSSSGIGVAGITKDSSYTLPSGSYGGYFLNAGSGDVALQGAETASGIGVVGLSNISSYSQPSGNYGVQGQAAGGSSPTGVLGVANGSTGTGIAGTNDSSGTGVFGVTATGTAVVGENTGSGGYGVYGETTAGYGVYGEDITTGAGVHGVSSTGNGVIGVSSNTSTGNAKGGVYGENTSGGWAGYFQGPLYATGNITCGGTCNSDIRLKQDVKPLTGALGTLLRLKGVTFSWKNPAEHQNHTGTQTGVIAC